MFPTVIIVLNINNTCNIYEYVHRQNKNVAAFFFAHVYTCI